MMDENGNEKPLSLDDVDKLEDVIDAIMLAEDNSINTDGCDDIEDIKARIKCHLRLKDGSPKEKLEQAIRKLGIKDEKKKDVLCRLVKDVMNIFPSQEETRPTIRQTMLEKQLSLDGTTANLRDDCRKRIASLQEKECVILVAGESSAGKSSLLNLLLGEPILPSHMLPCTSCITVIKYNYTKHARVIYKNGQVDNIDTLDKAGLEKLQERAYFNKNTKQQDGVYEKRKEGHEIAEIQIGLPLSMLYSGLVLVDTPGVGENEFLENYLLEYINNHHILGFMYIIMTDNALGIAEDRLVNLMSLIIKSQKNSSDVVKFDPNAALFVCNRWDMVPKESRWSVRKSTLHQLGKCWPEFDPNNVVFFSTEMAKREASINPGYITDDFVALLHGIHQLVDVSLDKRIKTSYRFLGNVLQRTVHYLKTMVRRLDMSDRQRQKKSEEATQKLKTLNNRADDVVKKLHTDLENAVGGICTKVRDYLATPQANMKLTKGWGRKEGELPDMATASFTWAWIKRHIESAFNDRLTDLLDDWDRDQKTIPDLEKKLFREAKLNLCYLENDLAEIENDVHDGDTISRISNVSLLNTLCRSIEDFEEDDLFDTNVPRKLLHRLSKILPKSFRNKQDDSKLKQFKKNPSNVAQQRAEKLLHAMLKDKDGNLEEFVREMMIRPFNYVRRLQNKIPNMVNANYMLLEKFEKDIIEESKCHTQYIEMMTRIEGKRRELINYGEDNFFANDFKADDIEIIAAPKKLLRKSSSVVDLLRYDTSKKENEAIGAPHGIWHTVHIGKICKGSETQYVAVKIYSKSSTIENILQEVAKLRCLLHSDVCIAEFLGVYQQRDTPKPALIYSGGLVSVKQYILTKKDVNEIKILSETLVGLQYIHSKGLVHMELTRDTVTVHESGEVRLTGTCLPRRESLSSVSDFVYLAPEVLRGCIYIECADMFSFAIFALEIKTPGFNAFSEFRSLPLGKFIEISAKSYLEPHILNLSLSQSVQKILLQCLEVDASRRARARDVAEELKNTNTYLTIARKTTATPRHLWRNFSVKKK